MHTEIYIYIKNLKLSCNNNITSCLIPIYFYNITHNYEKIWHYETPSHCFEKAYHTNEKQSHYGETFSTCICVLCKI